MTLAIPNGDVEIDRAVSRLERAWKPVTTLERQTPTRQVRGYVPRAHDGLQGGRVEER